METELGRQGAALLLGFGLGGLAGLCYDLIRPIRRRCGGLGGAALDGLFCVLAGGGLFLFAMGAGSGRLGLWDLAAALLGFLTYMHALSPPILPIFSTGLDKFCMLMASCKKIIKKTALSAKIIFQKMRECIIIKKRQ